MRFYRAFGILLWLWLLSSRSAIAAPNNDQALWQQYPGYQPIEVAGTSQITLWKDEQTPQKTGTTILLPDWGNRPTTADSIEPIRQQLPQWGWQTIALIPPQPEQKTLILDEQDEAATTTYQQQLQRTIEAVKQAQGAPFGYQVIVAQGVMAAWIVRVYSEQQLPLPDALVLISSYYPNPKLNTELANAIADLPIPVYDLYYRDSNRWSLQGARERLIAAHKKQKLNYRQSQINTDPNLQNSGKLLAKQLYGWFNALGWY